MDHIDYSVIIRTIGKAGEKYQALLDSIEQLKPRPKEVIVVLPEGYAKPAETLGWEIFYFCPKGMVRQRMTGIHKCKTRYALICDDDVCFGPDFVQKLYQPVAEGLCGLSAGPLYSFLPERGVEALISALTGAAVPTVFHRDRYVSVISTAGYSYNRHLKQEKRKYYGAQSLAWTCFFADLEQLRKIEIEDEIWLDAPGHSAYDDQTMFYKAWLRGIKTLVVADAYYEHNDARTAIRNNKPVVVYAIYLNRFIFWRRFIYDTKKTVVGKAYVRLAWAYRAFWLKLLVYADLLRSRCSKEELALIKKAHQDAWCYIKSQEYRNLPPVCQE